MKNNRLAEIIAVIGAYIVILILLGALLFVTVDSDSSSVEDVQETISEAKTEPMSKDIVMERSENVPEPVDDIRNAEVSKLDEVIVEAEESINYFNVPLSEELQSHIFALCEASGVDPAIVIAVIGKESNYDANAIGDGGRALGLMQIQYRWHWTRMDELDCEDLLNPFENVAVGIDYLAELLETGESIEWVLMAYNGGELYADRKIGNGEVSEYAVTVIQHSEVLK